MSALRWTSAPPTVAGWWWVRPVGSRLRGEWSVVDVEMYEGGLRHDWSGEGNYISVAGLDVEWSDAPLPEPEDGP